jgi:AraC-like DNA-binding protein
MRFEKILPAIPLRPYIRYYVIAENAEETQYKVFPSSGLVLGFQYRGQLSVCAAEGEQRLLAAGITGIADTYKVFKNSAGIGTLLVYFTETGWTQFSRCPAHELFNQSVALPDVLDKAQVQAVEEQLVLAHTDVQRIQVLNRFFLQQLKQQLPDTLVSEAVRLIYASGGNIQVRQLNQQLYISQSPLEKRFRKLVGTTPKKFASIVRFNLLLQNLDKGRSLTELGYEHSYFDQAHFIKDFKRFTGQTPEQFKRFL